MHVQCLQYSTFIQYKICTLYRIVCVQIALQFEKEIKLSYLFFVCMCVFLTNVFF